MERQEKVVLTLDRYEHGIMIRALNELRNDLLEEQRDPGPVEDVLLKTIDAPYEGFLIPILMRLLMTATELSASAETRGISYPCKKTHYILVDFRLRDGLLLIGMLALFAVVIWTSFQPISLF